MKHEKNIIQNNIDEYNNIIKIKVSKIDEIKELKSRIEYLEIECENLEIERKSKENIILAEIYGTYSSKELSKLVNTVKKYAKKEVADDCEQIVSKFDSHDLGVNDVTQLQTYIKIYGKYVGKENSIIKGLFKALGGIEDG